MKVYFNLPEIPVVIFLFIFILFYFFILFFFWGGGEGGTFLFGLPSKWGVLIKGKDLLPTEQILSFLRVEPLLAGFVVYRERK